MHDVTLIVAQQNCGRQAMTSLTLTVGFIGSLNFIIFLKRNINVYVNSFISQLRELNEMAYSYEI